jgi:hypothetical protein
MTPVEPHRAQQANPKPSIYQMDLIIQNRSRLNSFGVRGAMIQEIHHPSSVCELAVPESQAVRVRKPCGLSAKPANEIENRCGQQS